jgi:RNA recognition motif-containing protein
MRPVFCGNFDYDTRQYDLESLFSKYGHIRRIDMKSGIFDLFPPCCPCQSGAQILRRGGNAGCSATNTECLTLK